MDIFLEEFTNKNKENGQDPGGKAVPAGPARRESVKPFSRAVR